jgi:hypothetical protein
MEKRFEDLTERQQKACYVIHRKFGIDMEDIPPHFDALMRLIGGEITILQAERETGLVIIDQAHPRLF